MADDKTENPWERNRINLNDKYELAYWSRTFGVTEDELRAAVERVGNSVEDVALELESRRRKVA